MTTIKVLPRYFRPDASPPCEQQVHVNPAERGRNKRNGWDCGKHSAVVLNGRHLCLRHAQVAALDLLLAADVEGKS